jgi:hypothetical protein
LEFPKEGRDTPDLAEAGQNPREKDSNFSSLKPLSKSCRGLRKAIPK